MREAIKSGAPRALAVLRFSEISWKIPDSDPFLALWRQSRSPPGVRDYAASRSIFRSDSDALFYQILVSFFDAFWLQNGGQNDAKLIKNVLHIFIVFFNVFFMHF